MVSSPAVSTAGRYQESRSLADKCWGPFHMEDLTGWYDSRKMGNFPHDKSSSYRNRSTNRSGVKMLRFGSPNTWEMWDIIVIYFKHKIIPLLPQCYIVTVFLSFLQRLMNTNWGMFTPVPTPGRRHKKHADIPLCSVWTYCFLFVGVQKNMIIMVVLITVVSLTMIYSIMKIINRKRKK